MKAKYVDTDDFWKGELTQGRTYYVEDVPGWPDNFRVVCDDGHERLPLRRRFEVLVEPPAVEKTSAEVAPQCPSVIIPGGRCELSDGHESPHFVTAPATGFVKHDSGKPELDYLALLPIGPAVEVGKALEHGGKKYGFENWKKGTNWRRYLAACLRHLFAWARGEDKDPETGLSHLAHAAACILILMGLQGENLGTDDRVKT